MRWKAQIGVVGLAVALVAGVSTPSEAQRRRGPAVHARPRVQLGFFMGQRVGYPYWGPYGYYPRYPYAYGAYSDAAGVRIQVEPRNAEVFVDGRYAGVVDDFDGLLQRLRVPPGGHEITIYLEGFRTITERRYLSPRGTYRIQDKMVRLAPGETSGPRPLPEPSTGQERQLAEPGGEQPAVAGTVPPVRPLSPPAAEAPQPLAPAGEGQVPTASAFGRLTIRVQPADAQVSIDGEVWHGAPGQDRLTVNLPAGTHRVEVRKEGFAVFTKDVDVKPRETTVLNVSLTGLE
jgi:hypothetical protein